MDAALRAYTSSVKHKQWINAHVFDNCIKSLFFAKRYVTPKQI